MPKKITNGSGIKEIENDLNMLALIDTPDTLVQNEVTGQIFTNDSETIADILSAYHERKIQEEELLSKVQKRLKDISKSYFDLVSALKRQEAYYTKKSQQFLNLVFFTDRSNPDWETYKNRYFQMNEQSEYYQSRVTIEQRKYDLLNGYSLWMNQYDMEDQYEQGSIGNLAYNSMHKTIKKYEQDPKKLKSIINQGVSDEEAFMSRPTDKFKSQSPLQKPEPFHILSEGGKIEKLFRLHEEACKKENGISEIKEQEIRTYLRNELTDISTALKYNNDPEAEAVAESYLKGLENGWCVSDLKFYQKVSLFVSREDIAQTEAGKQISSMLNNKLVRPWMREQILDHVGTLLDQIKDTPEDLKKLTRERKEYEPQIAEVDVMDALESADDFINGIGKHPHFKTANESEIPEFTDDIEQEILSDKLDFIDDEDTLSLFSREHVKEIIIEEPEDKKEEIIEEKEIENKEIEEKKTELKIDPNKPITDQLTEEQFVYTAQENGFVVQGDEKMLKMLYQISKEHPDDVNELMNEIVSGDFWTTDNRFAISDQIFQKMDNIYPPVEEFIQYSLTHNINLSQPYLDYQREQMKNGPRECPISLEQFDEKIRQEKIAMQDERLKRLGIDVNALKAMGLKKEYIIDYSDEILKDLYQIHLEEMEKKQKEEEKQKIGEKEEEIQQENKKDENQIEEKEQEQEKEEKNHIEEEEKEQKEDKNEEIQQEDKQDIDHQVEEKEQEQVNKEEVIQKEEKAVPIKEEKTEVPVKKEEEERKTDVININEVNIDDKENKEEKDPKEKINIYDLEQEEKKEEELSRSNAISIDRSRVSRNTQNEINISMNDHGNDAENGNHAVNENHAEHEPVQDILEDRKAPFRIMLSNFFNVQKAYTGHKNSGKYNTMVGCLATLCDAETEEEFNKAMDDLGESAKKYLLHTGYDKATSTNGEIRRKLAMLAIAKTKPDEFSDLLDKINGARKPKYYVSLQLLEGLSGVGAPAPKREKISVNDLSDSKAMNKTTEKTQIHQESDKQKKFTK